MKYNPHISYAKRFLTPLERFRGSYRVNKESGCWEWTRGKVAGRYGAFSLNGKLLPAHRASWMLFKGNPNNLFVLHHCDNPLCVNPNHLFLGTQKDNVDDMIQKRRHVFGEQSCLSKLSQSQIDEIRAYKGMQKDMAKKFKVGSGTISRIFRGLSWKGSFNANP